MTEYSELVIFFLMLPLVIQILIPLLIFIGFGLLCAVKTMVGGQKVMCGVKDGVDIPNNCS